MGRCSSCCTASRSSGSVGGSRSSRSRRRAFGWSPPTRVATTCHRSQRDSRPTASTCSPPTSAVSSAALGAESALLVGHDWGGSIAWTIAMNHPEVVDRLAILNAAHPRRLSEGLHHPSQLRKSWYFFFFATPGLPEDVVHARDWHFFRHFLRRREPALHAAGDRTLRRGVVAARGRGRDDQLLPRLGAAVPEGSRRQSCARFRRRRWSSGASTIPTSAPNSPSPTAKTCPTSTASSASPTRRIGSITIEAERVNQLLIDFFA